MALTLELRRTRTWQAWGRLTRDARDTLFLLSVIGWTVLPHALHLPSWCLMLCAAVLLWRAQLALRAAPLPNRWALVAVLALSCGLTFWSFDTLVGKDAGITLAVVLMALKTLELRARRDAFVVFFLGFFLVLTQFFYSQSLAVAAAMLVAVWGLLTSLVLAHMPLGRPRLHAAGWLAARMALLGAPVMVLLFVLFPRVAPLWGVPHGATASTGLSDNLTLGGMAELALDDSVAFRVRFEGATPAQHDLYFRGPVLSAFDGRTWTALTPTFPPALQPHADLRTRGPAIRYEMTLEPLHLAVLPLLEAAVAAPEVPGHRVAQHDDLQWTVEAPLDERVRFDAVAYTDFQHGPAEPVVGLQDDIELPAGTNPRTLAWAAALRRDPRYATADARHLVAALLAHIRTGGYSYSLTPGTQGDDDPRHSIDAFWLDRKVGFCEHYAAAFVVVLRALDVPARIVTGYQGGDALPVDGFHIVRQRDAHAWAEYWQPGAGWLRADPTGAVAPDRIERPGYADRAAAAARDRGGFVGGLNVAWLGGLRSGWEAVNNRWNQWVLNYSHGAQMNLLKALGVEAPDSNDLALLLADVLTVLALGGAGWAWWDRRRIDPWTRQMQRIRAALAPLGLTPPAHHPPRTLALQIEVALGDRAPVLADTLRLLDAQRYGRDSRRTPDRQLTRRFESAARRLRTR